MAFGNISEHIYVEFTIINYQICNCKY